MGFDDALDAFGVHAIGGIVGGIATGFFATDQASPFTVPTPLLYDWAVKNKVTVDPTQGGYTVMDGSNKGKGTTYKYGPFGPPLGVYAGNLQQGGFQLAAQLCGICFAFGWSFSWTYVICQVCDASLTHSLSSSPSLRSRALTHSLPLIKHDGPARLLSLSLRSLSLRPSTSPWACASPRKRYVK